MSSNDAHKGGDLFDMAKDGTKIPNDAGKMNLIPSVPRPDQLEETNNQGLGDPNLQSAADNPIDVSRGTKDIGATGEVISGTGDQLPASIESKRLHQGANQPAAKGHQRDAKHGKEESDIERFAEDATK